MLATANTGEIGRGFGKNAGEWTRSVEISKEIKFLAVSVHTDLRKALKEECLCSVFSPDGTLISASAGPHCGAQRANPEHLTIILQQSYNNLTTILQQSYNNLTTILQQSYNNLTTILQ